MNTFETINYLYNQRRTITWYLNKWLPNSNHTTLSFSSNSTLKRVLLISEEDKICRSQIFPFYFYRPELVRKWKIDIKETKLRNFEYAPDKSPINADIVLLQTWSDIEKDRLNNILSTIKDKNPSAKIIFLDSFAPTDLRLAEWLNESIDVYLKKHVLRDRSQYYVPTRGDTNLVDYYGRLYKLDYEELHNSIPLGFLDKLVVGPSFVTGPHLLPHFAARPTPWQLPKTIDVHGRLAFKGGKWYQMMRTQAIEQIENLEGLKTLSTIGVSRKQYLRELRSSKICFSPFGYGEVCWRDYEAVMCGSLLVKPDMSHLETHPDIFIPHETYVPIKWDFSDFNAVINYYLKHDIDREKIVNQAYKVLHEYSKNNHFVDQMKPLFSI